MQSFFSQGGVHKQIFSLWKVLQRVSVQNRPPASAQWHYWSETFQVGWYLFWKYSLSTTKHMCREQRILMYFGLIEGIHQHLLSDYSLKAATLLSSPPPSNIYKIFTKEEESRWCLYFLPKVSANFFSLFFSSKGNFS